MLLTGGYVETVATINGMSCILDQRAGQSPPHLESGLAFRVALCLELGVCQQDGVERGQDLGAVVLGPADPVRVVRRRAGLLDVRARDLGTARDVVPQDAIP
jgi:hypothetical protein